MRLTLQPHQQEAVQAVVAEFAQSNRTNVAMACATGKTLVGFRVAELESKILILEPSLAMIHQTMDRARDDGLLSGRQVMCVCSDETVASGDDWKVTEEDLGVPVTTDGTTVRKFLADASDKCVVFCTYHSQPLLRDALPRGFQFDIAVFDEAHRTAGERDRAFSVALDQNTFPIGKRLFLTATPRLFAEPDGVSVDLPYSMDDETVYGRRAYTLSLPDAIARDIVCDYEVLIPCVTSADVMVALQKAQQLRLPQKHLPVEVVAGQIAVARAFQLTGAKRLISFHSTISAAAAFAKDRLNIFQDAGITPFHIHGGMPGRQRKAVLRAFLSMDTPSIITNCRCLTEGVDVPSIDMVTFISRKESVDDVVQATGRALRKSPGKRRGYVMLPIFVKADESIQNTLERSDMAVTWEILHTVLESDGLLADPIKRRKSNYDESHGDAIRYPSTERHRVVAPPALFEELQRAITMRHVERLGERWDVMIDAARQYAQREGNLIVPLDYCERGLPLGRWLRKQRFLHRKGRLTKYRSGQLQDIGIIWGSREEMWEAGLSLARRYLAETGNLNTLVDPAQMDLSRWLKIAKIAAAKGTLNPTRIAALEKLGVTLETIRSDAEQLSPLSLLRRWREEHPTGKPSTSGKDAKLGYYLHRCRRRHRLGTLAPEVADELRALGFDPAQAPLPTDFSEKRKANAMEKIEELRLWRAAHPTGRPSRHGPERRLAFFLREAANYALVGKLDLVVEAELAALGFSMDKVVRRGPTNYHKLGDASWDTHFRALQNYVRDNGWSYLWKTQLVDGLSLAGWVNYQRALKRQGRLSDERVAALDSVGIHWDRKIDWWVRDVEMLKRFRAEHGHQRFPNDRQYAQIRRRVALFRRRLTRGELPESLVRHLEEMGFARSVEAEYWEFMMHSLNTWVSQHGTTSWTRSDLPKPFQSFLQKLKRRHRDGGLPEVRLEALRKIGIQWATLDTTHATMIKRLSEIANDLGRANVEVMARRDAVLSSWLTSQVERAQNAELPNEAIVDLRQVGIDLDDVLPKGVYTES